MNEIARTEAVQPTPIKTAHRLRDVSEQNGALGVQYLWRVNPPLTERWLSDGDAEHYSSFEYVVASSVVGYSGYETLVFPSNEAGDILSYGELIGGREMSAEEVFASEDYEVIED